ncbi:hypothetical protein CHS0354_004707 [Potamilus streckersoni]|uniref:Uncharacterized protein n=1 Tax=Potamilus streckersoni TaxID=2493646 RepID=A0AAE0W5F1_9BIVA|nr:hypothetical protein CHS0354_004707 [Potamilus streckersoni]
MDTVAGASPSPLDLTSRYHQITMRAPNTLGLKQGECPQKVNLEAATDDNQIADSLTFIDEEHVMGSNHAVGPIVRTELESANLRTVKTRAQ